MNKVIANELEILWSSFEAHDVDEKLLAFHRLKAASTKNDLPQLIEALKSKRNDFWVRELLSEPISDLGGIEFLPELFDALKKNEDEGHDNDGFCHNLTEIAWAENEACKKQLTELMKSDDSRYKENAKWLLEFCE
ncbi:MAG: hypothetical protein ABW168_06835 [Sedimenticola sp.]